VCVYAAVWHSVVFLGIGIRGSRAVDVQSLCVEAGCFRYVTECCAADHATPHHNTHRGCKLTAKRCYLEQQIPLVARVVGGPCWSWRLSRLP
jgi:hypothetical protein